MGTRVVISVISFTSFTHASSLLPSSLMMHTPFQLYFRLRSLNMMMWPSCISVPTFTVILSFTAGTNGKPAKKAMLPTSRYRLLSAE